MRTFVILSTKNLADPCENILKFLPKDAKTIVYMQESKKGGEFHSKIENFRIENPI